MSTKNRKIRELQMRNSAARRRFRFRSRELGLNVLEQAGVCHRTIDDAIELLEEAGELLTHDEFQISQSSSPETGVFLTLARRFIVL